MKRTLFYILLFSGLLIVADCCARPVVGFITNGEGCNVDWRKELPEYDVADAGEKNFLLSRQSWNLDERLLNRRPDCCMVYSGLPEILLGQPLPTHVGGLPHDLRTTRCRRDQTRDTPDTSGIRGSIPV